MDQCFSFEVYWIAVWLFPLIPGITILHNHNTLPCFSLAVDGVSGQTFGNDRSGPESSAITWAHILNL